MIRNAKVGDRVMIPNRSGIYGIQEKSYADDDPIAYWDFGKGIATGTVVHTWKHAGRVYIDVKADPPNFGVLSFRAGELKRIAQNPAPHSCYLCGKELVNLNHRPYCPHCQIYSMPACPVCGKGYIQKLDDPINGDHYYHIREVLFGNIPHYPPSGLCVDREDHEE